MWSVLSDFLSAVCLICMSIVMLPRFECLWLRIPEEVVNVYIHVANTQILAPHRRKSSISVLLIHHSCSKSLGGNSKVTQLLFSCSLGREVEASDNCELLDCHRCTHIISRYFTWIHMTFGQVLFFQESVLHSKVPSATSNLDAWSYWLLQGSSFGFESPAGLYTITDKFDFLRTVIMNSKNHPDNHEGLFLFLIAILTTKGAKLKFLSDY